MEKAGNFSRNASEAVAATSDGHQNNQRNQKQDEPAPGSSPGLSRVMEAVDRFIETTELQPPAEIPSAVESFPEMVDSMVSKFESSKSRPNEDENSSFFDVVNRISKLVNRLRESHSDSSSVSSCLNRASSVQHRAITLLDEEFRHLLDHSKRSNNGSTNSEQNPKGTPKAHKQASSNSTHESDRCVLPESEQKPRDAQFPDFSPESIFAMKNITGAMILAGYEGECCMVYEISRRQAFKDELTKLGFENINVEDVQRMTWECLEGEIAAWISVVRHCSNVLFPGERGLCDAVFASHPSVSRRLFTDLTSAVSIRFIDFSGAVVLMKRSSEKLFKFLDMYEALGDLIPTVEVYANDMASEITVARSRLGEAALSIFCELENSIKSDNGRIPVPSGAVHPLTRYTMNYLKYACEYKDTLEQVFQQHQRILMDQDNGSGHDSGKKKPENQEDDGTPKTSPFAIQLMTVMDLLDANLDMKSKLYRDPSLRYIFLMNNGRYILQKIKGCQEIRDLMGASWTRKRSSDLRRYHKSYQRETWSRVLQCMSHEGLQVNGKVLKPVLKERFKNFNALFDEIHKTQSTWVVSDEQLQSELRVSISAVVIPAYRSFLGRFKQHMDSGRQAEKYIKYQPEDIETLIEELFDGNLTSMARRRT